MTKTKPTTRITIKDLSTTDIKELSGKEMADINGGLAIIGLPPRFPNGCVGVWMLAM